MMSIVPSPGTDKTAWRFHRKVVGRRKPTIAALALLLAWSSGAMAGQRHPAKSSSGHSGATVYKLDEELTTRAALGASWRRSRVIVQLDGSPLPSDLKQYQRSHLDLIDAY